jgi:hypothetical protein
MALMEAVLHRVSDHERVIERMEKSPALRELVESYHHFTQDDANLANITSLTTGAELKDALRQLKPEAQIDLLKKYCDTIHGVVAAEPAHQVEERRNRHWMLRFCVLVGSSILLIMLATFASVVFKGTGADTNVFTSVMSTTLEIAKLIFNISK